MNDTQQKLDRAEQLIIQVLLNISKSTEILSNNLDEVNSINNSSNNNNNMNNNVNNINQLTLQIINNMNEVGTILKENKQVLFPLEDYTNRKNVKSTLLIFKSLSPSSYYHIENLYTFLKYIRTNTCSINMASIMLKLILIVTKMAKRNAAMYLMHTTQIRHTA